LIKFLPQLKKSKGPCATLYSFPEALLMSFRISCACCEVISHGHSLTLMLIQAVFALGLHMYCKCAVMMRKNRTHFC